MKGIKGYWIFSGIIVLFNVFIYTSKTGGEKSLAVISDLLPVICSFTASVTLFMAFSSFKKMDYTKVAWMMLFLGITFNFFAETTYGVLELGLKMDMNQVFPTIADYIWNLGYIPVFIGLAMMFIGYEKSGLPTGNKLYFIVAAVVLVLSSFVIYFLLVPIITDEETDLVSKYFYMFYPIGDLLVVIPAIILMRITSLFGKGFISKPWRFLAFGFICFTLADLLYSFLSWRDLYGSGNFIDIAWNSGYLLIGASGLYQKKLIQLIDGGEK